MYANVPRTGIREDSFACGGGLDITSPQISMRPGRAIGCMNYEVSSVRGYQRIDGYERRDGRQRPSDAAYTVLAVAAPLDAIAAVGDTLNGQTSGATGVVVYIEPGRAWFAVTKVTGTFLATENYRKVATVVGAGSSLLPPITQSLDSDLLDLAAANYRADIAAVPGSGPVRGVWVLANTLYAVRDNAGGTAGVLHRATTSGWAPVTLNEIVSFTGGNTAMTTGATLTQGGVTATILRVSVRSGTSPNLAGVIIITGRTGGNFAGGAATTNGGGTLTLGGAQAAVTLPAGGKYRTVTHNFTGSLATRRTYGANGVGQGFEFDGTVWVPISTGMAADTPTHVFVHRNHLFYSFNGSAQHSSIADPYRWSPILGAGEIGLGDTITGFAGGPGSEVSGSLFIFTKDATFVLYGKSAADWNLVQLSDTAGAINDTARRVFYPVALDSAGIVAARSEQVYGNFEQDAVISEAVQPIVASFLQVATDSIVVQGRRQYRLFGTDGRGLTVTFDREGVLGIMPFTLPISVTCTWSGEENGREALYVGASNGFVYELNRGRSFDGAAFDWYIRLAFNSMRSPQSLKSFKRAFTELRTQSSGSLNVGYELGYASAAIPQPQAAKVRFDGQGGRFDEANFDSFFFDSAEFTQIGLDLEGDANNISYIYSGSSAKELPHTLFGVVTHFIPRRLMRNVNA